MTTKHVTVHGHTSTVNGKVVWVPEYQKDIEVGLGDDFAAHFPAPPKAEPNPEPAPQPKATGIFDPNTATPEDFWIGHNQEPGHNKVYKTAIFKMPDGSGYIVSQFGKAGGTLKQVVHGPYKPFAQAAKEYTLLKVAKIKKGYLSADSDVWHETEKKKWEPIVYLGQGEKEPIGAEPAPPSAAPAKVTEPQFAPEGMAEHFKAIFGEAPKAGEHEAPAPQSPEPAKPGADADPNPLQQKANIQGGKFVQYGEPGKGVAVFHKVNGVTPELRIKIEDKGDYASVLKHELEDTLGAKWMPIAKVYAFPLKGFPWASGKAQAQALHNFIAGFYGQPTDGAAPVKVPTMITPAGIQVEAAGVQPGMKFKLLSATNKAEWTVHDVGPQGIFINKKDPNGKETDKVWVNHKTWESDYKPHLLLAEDFTGKVLHVGDTKVEGGKTYKLNENHKWELVPEAPPMTSEDLKKAWGALSQTGDKLVMPNGFTIGKGMAGGKKSLRIYSSGLTPEMVEQLKAEGWKENDNGYFWIVPGAYLTAFKNLSEVMKHNPKPSSLDPKKMIVPAEPKAATPKPSAPATPALPPPPPAFPFTQIGPQKGSNPGGLFQDQGGKKWYIKFPPSEEHAKNELLAAQLYKMVGLPAPKLKLVSKDGKVGIASKWEDDLVSDAKTIGSTPGAVEGFGMDAWLANWDVAGLGFDNILKNAEGKAIRIDVGGSLLFRAQGAPKGAAFGNTVPEIHSLTDPEANPNTAKIFSKMTEAQKIASIAKVVEIPNDIIEAAVQKFGPGTDAEKKALAAKLIARKDYLGAQFPAAHAMAFPPKPDPSKLPVASDDFPKAPNFSDWNGTGKGPSGNASINEQNQKAADSIYAVATSGNLTALKALTYVPVGSTTPESMANHKSQHITKMYAQCLATLEGIADPHGTHAKTWDLSSYIGNISDISESFPAYHYGVTKNTIATEKRLGFWLSIGDVDGAETVTPPMEHHVTAEEKAIGSKSNAKIPSIVKQFMKDVKDSGSANNPYRNGQETDHSGNKCRDVIAAAYEHAAEFKPGATIKKFIDFQQEPGMKAQLLGKPIGHIFQNPGSMCCSLLPEWSWSGEAELEIVYAEGAKALYNIGVGNHNSEGEVTTLPGQRFMILNSKQKAANGKAWFKLLMLPPDPAYIATIHQKGAA